MTNIIKKENGKAPATFGNVVDQIFQNNLSRFFSDEYWGFNGVQNRNAVPVNIRENETGYEMQVVAPGWKKEDFKLNVNGDLLTVSCERKQQQEENSHKWVRSEFRLQSFTRSFSLEEGVEAENITARYEDGVLYITLPKKAEAQQPSKNIQIQ